MSGAARLHHATHGPAGTDPLGLADLPVAVVSGSPGFVSLLDDFFPLATDASIRAAATAANALGGGTVHVPKVTLGGWAPIVLSSPLPVYPGVKYSGKSPVTTPDDLVAFADGFAFTGGTVLQGDGTFPAFCANWIDQTAISGSVKTEAVRNFSVVGIGLQGFSDGLRIGANNIMGMMYGALDQLYVRNCTPNTVATLSGALSTGGGAITALPVNALASALARDSVAATTHGDKTQMWVLTAPASVGATSLAVSSQTPNYNYQSGCTVTDGSNGWGVYLGNPMFVDVGLVHTCECTNGQYYASLIPSSSMIPGNMTLRNVMNITPRDSRNGNFSRGLVFETGSGTTMILNELTVLRAQNNRFKTTLTSVTASFTNTATAISVADGTKFAPGFWCSFTTPPPVASGAAGQMYYVSSVAGNNITIRNSRNGADLAATSTTTATVQTYGFANIETGSQNATTGLTNSKFLHVDSEGVVSAGLYAEGTSVCEMSFADMPGTALIGVVGRKAAYTRFSSYGACSTDFDGNSTTSEWVGSRSTTYQRGLRGSWFDSTLTTNVLALNGGGIGAGGDIQARQGGFLYPNMGLGERIFARNSSIALTGGQAGTCVFAGSGASTFTLPTIVIDTTSPNLSHVGLVFDIYNLGTVALTVATDGTQLFNKVASLTSLSVPVGARMKVVGMKDASNNLFWATYGTGVLGAPTPTTVVNAGSLGAAFTQSCAGSPDLLFTGTMTATGTLTFTNLAVAQAITARLTQDATGGRVLTLSPTPKTPGGAGIVLSTAPNAIDVVTLYSPDGTNLDAFVAGKAMA